MLAKYKKLDILIINNSLFWVFCKEFIIQIQIFKEKIVLIRNLLNLKIYIVFVNKIILVKYLLISNNKKNFIYNNFYIALKSNFFLVLLNN